MVCHRIRSEILVFYNYQLLTVNKCMKAVFLSYEESSFYGIALVKHGCVLSKTL